MYKPEDGPDASGFMSGWNTADRLVEELYSEAGAKYSDAVRRCIRCDFDRRATSLDDCMRLQKCNKSVYPLYNPDSDQAVRQE